MLTAQIIGSGAVGGLRSIHFFNGRLLTAEDLKAEQEAGRRRVHWLGQATGTGVISGLEVRATGVATLQVSAGLALSRAGQAFALTADVALALQSSTRAAPGNGAFQPVRPAEAEAGPEVYVLVATAASWQEERAPLSGLGTGGRISGTDSRYTVESVCFRLIPLSLPDGPADADSLRNRAAHLCFGSTLSLPPAGPSPYGALAQLGAGGALTDADVPLALLGWWHGQLHFLDMWSVRRRVQPATAFPWPLGGGDGQAATAEAMLCQFQDQVEDLRRREADCTQILAASRFCYLPPVGHLPLGPGGFRWQRFFASLAVEQFAPDPGFLGARLQQATAAAPIDLADPAPLWVCVSPAGDRAFFLRREQPQAVIVQPSPAMVVDVHLPGVITPFDPSLIRVYAADEAGKEYPGELLGRCFRIDPLPEGACTVWATAKGCQTVGRRRTPVVGTVRLRLDLLPAPSPPEPPAPPGHLPAEQAWAGLPAGGRLTLAVDALQWGPLPAPLLSWRRPGDLTPALREWLQAWAAWLQTVRPELPIDPQNITLLLNPAPAAAPAARALFGDGGACVPVQLAAAALPEPSPAGLLESAAPTPPVVATPSGERGAWSFFLEFLGFPPR